ncbi:MAG: COX15/CtaA family protein [Bacteroidota bacterium]
MKKFGRLAKISLILVYLVIAAGAVVRMTGSGMGCPDWPKCFGYYIPPTDAQTLQWQAQRTFEKGQVIIINESLKIAKSDFKTGLAYNETNWESYTKHDYAMFNVWHTWIEYINRLLGALAGLSTLLLAFFSLRFWRSGKRTVIFSWLVVLGMGFQAWLGATVVHSVLEPFKITVHMIMALVIVAMLLYVIATVGPVKGEPLPKPTMAYLLVGALFLTLVQVILGTQVRQFVDGQIDVMGENTQNLWLQRPTVQFYIHRSFSILVLAINTYLWWTFRKHNFTMGMMNWVMLLIFLEILTGMAMYYFDFPFSSQPLHLVLASLLFGAQFYLAIQVLNSRRIIKSS